ncbi:MAG: isoprenylcysteine carboxylmethyltransferase family protein [Bacteroidota bacterium]|nr:isoprenylcysteine carboxylmethyltransferase family protein [Bacteroidota bacterium]
MDFRQALFKFRSYTPIPFLVVMAIVAHPTFTSMLVGFGFVLIGEAIRLWGVSYAGSETRTTGQVGATALITTGPFSRVRNPLYLGNMTMYFGLGIMANTPLLAIVGLFYFFFQYTLIVSLEEESLFKKFPEEYLRYYQSVPRFIPTIKKYSGGGHPQPAVNWKGGIISERRTFQAIASVVIMLIVFWFLRG